MKKAYLYISFFVMSAIVGLVLFQNFTASSPDELSGKFFVGYQGWFATPNDGTGKGWQHWGKIPEGQLTVEMWPDNSEYAPVALMDSGLTLANGNPGTLFSSHYQNVTDTHFRWMKAYGMDGALVQRFVIGLKNNEACVQAPVTFLRGSVLLKSGQTRFFGCLKINYATNGNFYIYDAVTNALLWNAKASFTCSTMCSAVFGSDGTLALLNASNVAYWKSNNTPTTDAQLVFRGRRPFVQIESVINKKIIWAENIAEDIVLKNVLVSAPKYTRNFVIEYDVTGAVNNPNCYPGNKIPADRSGFSIKNCIQKDWMRLVDDLNLGTQGSYFKYRGRPLVAIFGLGFAGSNYVENVRDAQELINWFHYGAEPKYQASLLGGVPSYWRTLSGDSRSEPEWKNVYASFDVLSPWMVGRFGDKPGALDYINRIGAPDIELTKSRGQKYLPVIFPGFSWKNLMNFYGQPERAIANQTPRMGGKFYWAQAYHWRSLGVDSFFGAMFDEVDEGTALFKTAPNKLSAPHSVYTLTLDADGFNLSSDWYLRVSKTVSSLIKGDVLTEVMPLASYPAGSLALKSGTTLNLQMARLSFQEDGNLVLYNHLNQAVWATNTREDCRAQICTAKFQGDGNFVFYKYDVPFWAISPAGSASKLVISHDAPYIQIISSVSGVRLWSKELGNSAASALFFNPGGLTLISNFSTLSLKNTLTVFQPDGNLVMYNKSTGAPLWSSRTFADCGKSECVAKFQNDGNFVIYRFGVPIWSTGTKGARIEFSDFAPYLKIINENGQVVYQ